MMYEISMCASQYRFISCLHTVTGVTVLFVPLATCMRLQCCKAPVPLPPSLCACLEMCPCASCRHPACTGPESACPPITTPPPPPTLGFSRAYAQPQPQRCVSCSWFSPLLMPSSRNSLWVNSLKILYCTKKQMCATNQVTISVISTAGMVAGIVMG